MTTELWSKPGHPGGGSRNAHRRAREVISTSGGIMRSKFPSRKNNRVVHCEGLLELDAAYLFEVNPLVATFSEQPITIHYPDGSRVRRYTPDFEVTLTSGLIVWVEIKPLSSLANSEVRHKLSCVAEHLTRAEQPYTVLNDGVLRQEPRRANVQQIFHRASRQPRTSAATAVALRRGVSKFPRLLSDATCLLAAEGLEPYSLLMAGLLRCDLSQPLTGTTLITINQENDDAWFRLSEEFEF